MLNTYETNLTLIHNLKTNFNDIVVKELILSFANLNCWAFDFNLIYTKTAFNDELIQDIRKSKGNYLSNIKYFKDVDFKDKNLNCYFLVWNNKNYDYDLKLYSNEELINYLIIANEKLKTMKID